MHESLSSPAPGKQPLLSRIFWFGVGGGLSVALNFGACQLLQKTLLWPDGASYATSLALVTLVFSIWNYYLNFRTNHGLRECTTRYLVCIALCQLINYFIVLTGMSALGHDWFTKLLLIGTVQVAMGGLKFLLYHFWVYPHAAAD